MAASQLCCSRAPRHARSGRARALIGGCSPWRCLQRPARGRCSPSSSCNVARSGTPQAGRPAHRTTWRWCRNHGMTASTCRPRQAFKTCSGNWPTTWLAEDRKFKRTFFSQSPPGNSLEHPLMRPLVSAAACCGWPQPKELHPWRPSPGFLGRSGAKPRL